MLCIVVVDGFFKTVNPGFANLGYSNHEPISTSYFQLLHPEDEALVRNEVEKLKNGIPTVDFESRLLRKDKVYRRFSWICEPDESIILYSIGRDIADKMQGEEKLRKSEDALINIEAILKRVIFGINDGIFEWNTKTGKDFHSVKWCQLLGYDDYELPDRGEAFFQLIHSENRTLVASEIQKHFEKNSPNNIKVRLKCKTGDLKWFHTKGATTGDPYDSPNLFSGAITAISRPKEIEPKLQSKNQSLDEAIGSRDEMVGIISHEIKNQLAVLQVGIEMMTNLLPQTLNSERIEKILLRLHPSVQRMNQLISDLLDITRMEEKAL